MFEHILARCSTQPNTQQPSSQRNIQQEWIETALTNSALVQPDADDAELEHRLAVIEEHGNRVLRVVVKRNTQPAFVITAYFDRKLKGKL